MIHRNVHVLMCVVRIQGHQHSTGTIGVAENLPDDLEVDRGSFNQFHFKAEGMLVEGLAVVGADVNVDTDEFAGGLPRIQHFHYIQKTKHGRGKKRPAVCDAAAGLVDRPLTPYLINHEINAHGEDDSRAREPQR